MPWDRERARTVGVHVRAARQEAGLTQRALASTLRERGYRVRQTQISRLERGLAGSSVYENRALLSLLADVLGVDTAWLQADEAPGMGDRQ